MIDKTELDRVVAFIDNQLRDLTLSVGFLESIPRREDVGPKEMTNGELMEEVEKESDEDPGLMVEEGGPEPSGAYIHEGTLYIVDQGDKYGVPLEDIEEILVLDPKTVVFNLVMGTFSIIWMSQEDIDDYGKKYRSDEE